MAKVKKPLNKHGTKPTTKVQQGVKVKGKNVKPKGGKKR